TDGRHRVSGVERETPRRCVGTGQLGTQFTIMMEVKRCILSAKQGPLSLVAPAPAVIELALRRAPAAAASHDEDPHRRLVLDGCRNVLQPAIEESLLLLEVAAHAPDRLG